MDDLLERSARYLDSGVIDGEFNPMGLVQHELADRLALVEGFSHVVAFDTGDGLVCFDTSLGMLAPRALASLREWSNEPVHTIVYTHGHADHVGGAPAILAEAHERGQRRPEVVGHENVPARFDRYDLTEGYVRAINARQFGGSAIDVHESMTQPSWVRPSVTYAERLDWRVGDLTFELHHGKGETDDHTWSWVPSHRAALVGDFLIWMFPNAGNPQKVQRYPREWARALREIAAKRPELLVPAHGLPVQGEQRVATILDDTARALELLVEQVLVLMNEGHRLDQIIHTVRVPDELMARPWLRPLYDEPEFVIHNIWRLYGGWYDGNPARLKPPPDELIAHETARLAGGADVLVRRALELSEGDTVDDNDLRLACHLVELAAHAAPDDPEIHEARAEVYRRRRRRELSLMAKGVFGDAERVSTARAEYLRS